MFETPTLFMESNKPNINSQHNYLHSADAWLHTSYDTCIDQVC